MHFALAFAILITLMPNFFPEAGVDEKTSVFTAGKNNEIRLNEAVEPFTKEKFRHIINQEHDFSCGSAALATLLNYYLNESLNEKQVIRGLMEFGDRQQIKKLRAFSLWDMQQFLQAIGYKSGGYKATMEDLLNKDHWPCIVPINVFNYKHFVVLKGIYKDHVFIADPFIGNSSYTLEKFKKIWDRDVMFIVWADSEKTISALKLSQKDLRYIDKDFQASIMLGEKNILNKTDEYRDLESQGWIKYKK